MEEISGVSVPKRSLEEVIKDAAVDFDAFLADRIPELSRRLDSILVASKSFGAARLRKSSERSSLARQFHRSHGRGDGRITLSLSQRLEGLLIVDVGEDHTYPSACQCLASKVDFQVHRCGRKLGMLGDGATKILLIRPQQIPADGSRPINFMARGFHSGTLPSSILEKMSHSSIIYRRLI